VCAGNGEADWIYKLSSRQHIKGRERIAYSVPGTGLGASLFISFNAESNFMNPVRKMRCREGQQCDHLPPTTQIIVGG
jgi:hypothetical protein